MRVLRDFKCEDGHVTERFIDAGIDTVQCSKCQKEAARMLGYGSIMLDGTDPSLPGAYDKWARVREQRAEITRRKNS